MPDSFHNDEAKRAVIALLNGQDVFSPIYIKEDNRRKEGPGKLVTSGRVVILEGLFALLVCQRICVQRLDIFIEADRLVREKRRVQKDLGLGIPPEIIRRVFRERVERNYDPFVLPQKDEVQLVVITD